MLSVKDNLMMKFGLKAPLFNLQQTKKSMEQFTELGITKEKRKIPLIVSLTSFPPRIKEVRYAIFSILKQTMKPDKVILWLAEEQFPQKERELPTELLKLKENGLEIKWCHDIRSYKKLIPSLLLYPNALIVTADDDLYYTKNWLEKLYIAHLKDPQSIIGHRCHQIKLKKSSIDSYSNWRKNVLAIKPSYRNFLTTGAGILYPPHSLHPNVTKKELFMQIAPYADDIWFWGMAVLNGKKLKNIKHRMRKLMCLNLEREQRKNDEPTLAKINISLNGNDQQMYQLLETYPEILEKLK